MEHDTNAMVLVVVADSFSRKKLYKLTRCTYMIFTFFFVILLVFYDGTFYSLQLAD